MKYLSPALLVLALSVSASAAMAQSTETSPEAGEQMSDHGDGHGRGEGRGHGGKHRDGKRGGGRHHMMIDANADGIVGEDEVAALADAVFSRHDRDNDGFVTEAEALTPPRKGWFSGNSAEDVKRTEARKAFFTTLDADKDQKVSKAEAFAQVKVLYAAADTDKDGKVTPFEIRLVPRPF